MPVQGAYICWSLQSGRCVFVTMCVPSSDASSIGSVSVSRRPINGILRTVLCGKEKGLCGLIIPGTVLFYTLHHFTDHVIVGLRASLRKLLDIFAISNHEPFRDTYCMLCDVWHKVLSGTSTLLCVRNLLL